MSISLIYLLFIKLISARTNAHILSQPYDRVTFQEASGNYVDSHYLSTHSIISFSKTSTGDKAGFDLENAFHTEEYWVSDKPNTDQFHSSIFITFNEPTTVEAFLLMASIKTDDQNRRTYHGFPTKIKIYISQSDDEPFILHTLFVGTPSYPLETAQFIFKNPVKCKKMQLEFVEVTEEHFFSNGAKAACIRYLSFYKKLDYDTINYQIPNGNYDSSFYVNFHKLQPITDFSYSSSGEKEGYSISNAFDDSNGNFWVANSLSDDISSTSHIIINFKKSTLLEGFLLKGNIIEKIIEVNTKYPGYPTKLNFYVAMNGKEFQLHTKFSGNPSKKKSNYQFILAEKVLCDQIKLEFVDVVNDEKFTNSKTVVVDQITLLQAFEGLPSQGVNGNYADGNYVSTNKVQNGFTITATGGSEDNHQIENVVNDDDKKTFWISRSLNTDSFKNEVLVTFENPVLIEAVLMDPVYQTNKKKVRTFSGFPTKFNIYTALDDEEFTLRSAFYGMPEDETDRVQFVLPNTFNCTKLKLEFVEVTPYVYDGANGDLHAAASELIFIRKPDFDVLEYHKNRGYTESQIIPSSKISSVSSNGHKNNDDINKAFDDDDSTHWVSNIKVSSTSPASIFINFTQPVKLEGFLLGAYYKKIALMYYYGYPTELNVYASNEDNEPFKLKATFKGSPDDDTFFQFTLKEPFICTRIQIDILDSTKDSGTAIGNKNPGLSYIKLLGEVIDFTTSDPDDFTTQFVNNSFPLNGINDTDFVINDLPSDNDYLFVVEKKFYFHNVSFSCPDALMSAIKSNHSNQVIVKKCKFNKCSVKSEIGNGGAILSLNCAFKCDNSEFSECKSKQNGGGGGVFVVLNENVNEDVVVEKCKFVKCSATFGGALYLFSNVESSSVIVKGCTFESNSLFESSSSASSNSLFGGSAIYMNVLRGMTLRCKFVLNEGDCSLKIENNLDKDPSRLLKEISIRSAILVEKCEFEIGSSAKSSLSFVQGSKKVVNTDVVDCVFKGTLLEESHHINVKVDAAGKQRLTIKSCKFACDRSKSINMKFDELSNSFVVFNSKMQIFNYNENDKDAESTNSRTMFAMSLAFIFVAIMASVAVIFAFGMKKYFDDKENDKKDDALNHPIDIDL